MLNNLNTKTILTQNAQDCRQCYVSGPLYQGSNCTAAYTRCCIHELLQDAVNTSIYKKHIYIYTHKQNVLEHHDDASGRNMASNRTNKTQKKQVKDKKINTADGGGTCISKQTITHKYR